MYYLFYNVRLSADILFEIKLQNSQKGKGKRKKREKGNNRKEGRNGK